MPHNAEREYRSMACMAVKRSAEDAEQSFRIEGYATTFDEPYLLYEMGGEKLFESINPHAFDDCDMSDCILQFDHAGMVYARTRNNSLQLEVDEHGLKVTADLGLTEESRKVWEAINVGLIDRMSFCFTVDKDTYHEDTNTDEILSISKLYDVSVVSIPANPMTQVSTARKALMDGEIQKRQAERLEKSRKAKKARILRAKLKLMEE